MGLKMKNVDITGAHQFLAEGGRSQKIYIYGELPKNKGWRNLVGTWQKIGRRKFLRGVDTSVHTMT